ncbi:NfeD family protein [Candidatus Neptunochlamydia vexilliferae]|uniref:NfeD-like C-terminal domain-containing protein n=1 Tax=Candidatus Neptunichlamydia vexilliferae TaxID=1651774 RepID=A0ABS0B0Z2_9BACT|nr:NfeD family protein [Candidatus Neptunochlamydia vexilliferae]MBF5060059.1 hypothetical protein [Candidatus Neptunochlamydia vexilliferae]
MWLKLFLLFTFSLFGHEAYLNIQGYADQEMIVPMEKEVCGCQNLVIQINSSSGDFDEVVSLAQEIHREKPFVTVYIQGKAVGPAAMLPFLADELIVTPFAAWGDIPYGVKHPEPPEKVRALVQSLVDKEKKHFETLSTLADAMVDPHHQLGGFDPLILNVEKMKSLGLVDEVLSDEAFAAAYAEAPREDNLSEVITYSDTEENLIGYISIEKERAIDQSTYIYVKFALKDFIEKGVRFVVLNLNTPGGEVLAALKIVDLLQKLDIQHHIPVIAFIDDWAVSAGAMLAYSCRFIGTQPKSLMGAAEPVIMGKEGQMESASEKVSSALRAEFANLANFYGRDPLIAEAMVDKDLILVWRDHQVVQLRSMDEVESDDTIIIEKGKLLTLNGKELKEFGVSDFEVPITPLPPITEKEQKEGMWPAKKSLVFQQHYLKHIPDAVMVEYQDWRVGFFSFLTHPMIASLLFMGLILGLYIEINSPSFGVPGSIALGCLVLILLSSFASHAYNWIEIIILCAGLILLALELFVIPGFGITGVLGIILTIIALFALMLPGIGQLNLLDPETFRLVGMAFVERLAWLCGGLLVAIVVIILLARFFSHRYFRFSKLILKGEQEGYVAGIPKDEMPEKGTHGTAFTPLRPSGKVEIGGKLFDAVTLGGFVEKDAAIEVVRIEGSKVIVKEGEE